VRTKKHYDRDKGNVVSKKKFIERLDTNRISHIVATGLLI
jgi:hypothetical protein